MLKFVPFFKSSYFFIINIKKKNRIIAIASEAARETMSSAKHFFGDGTFKTCPRPFLQLYTLYANVGSSEEETKIMPVVYALLLNKKQSTYDLLFTLIKKISQAGIHRNSQSILMLILTIEQIFPEASVKGYYYHFNRAIWKRAEELNLLLKAKLIVNTSLY